MMSGGSQRKSQRELQWGRVGPRSVRTRRSIRPMETPVRESVNCCKRISVRY